MKNVHVSVCTGTACYLLGAAHLLTLEEILDPITAEHVEFSGAHCLGLCGREELGKPPFAKVNDHVIADATLNKLLDKVREELGLETV
ncbi:NAD(P)H-dependent oxidoreductase subunit E [Pontiella sp.]|uniref:NAD(P)H-dependent oxidoreductase subunit E n=1 Tax=Pontiella sp. TaxID=2837462 RepID=UPI0035683212